MIRDGTEQGVGILLYPDRPRLRRYQLGFLSAALPAAAALTGREPGNRPTRLRLRSPAGLGAGCCSTDARTVGRPRDAANDSGAVSTTDQ